MLTFDELSAACEAITEKQMARVTRQLKNAADDAIIIGVIHSDTARRLMAVSDVHGHLSNLLSAQADGADTPEEEETLNVDAFKHRALANLAREVCWFECRASMDQWSDWSDADTLQITTGWMLTKIKVPTPSMVIRRMIEGGKEL